MSRYYRSRPYPTGIAAFEDTYWQKKTDPDGNVRNLTEERARKLEDMKEELEFVNALPAGRVLDVGSGLGHFLSAVDPKHSRFGFEVSRWACEWASKQYGAGPPPIVFWRDDDLRSVGFIRNSFTAVVLYHVIEHVVHPEDLIDACFRILKYGGHLIVGTPDFESAAAQWWGVNFRLLHDPTHISLFGRDGLRDMLRDYGFEVERVAMPYFGTRHAERAAELASLHDDVSPPCPGSIVTAFARKIRR